MDQFLAALDGAWRVLVTCIVLGSGLPALFTLGLRQLAIAEGATQSRTTVNGRAARRTVAIVLFAVIILAILSGIGYIVAHGLGYSVAFQGFLPVVTKK